MLGYQTLLISCQHSLSLLFVVLVDVIDIFIMDREGRSVFGVAGRTVTVFNEAGMLGDVESGQVMTDTSLRDWGEFVLLQRSVETLEVPQ